jgi:ubiquinone/menaquinone biosynthesis C-methylase UbiE
LDGNLQFLAENPWFIINYMTDQSDPHQMTRDAWEANAEIWDARMGDEGNDFFTLLCWPALVSLLDPKPGRPYLDIACGNGLTSRRLAALGAQVTAFDFSANLIEKAKARSTDSQNPISFHVIDATDEQQLLSLAQEPFDAALSNMALFDMADIETLFRTLPRLLKPGGIFVFSLTHPCFNNSSSVFTMEEWDEGEIKTVYSVKVSRYMTLYHARGVAFRNQPKAHMYFERPLQYYMNLGFQNGFVLDGFEERAFPPDHPQTSPLGWGGRFSEIPPVLVARFRLRSEL